MPPSAEIAGPRAASRFNLLSFAALLLLGGAAHAFPVRLDAKALSARFFHLEGHGKFTAAEPMVLDLEAGTYRISSEPKEKPVDEAGEGPAAPGIEFRVDERGKVDYDQGAALFLAGKGGSELRIKGAAFELDLRAFGKREWTLNDWSFSQAGALVITRLLPGRQELSYRSGPSRSGLFFHLDAEGRLHLDSAFQGLAEGQGSARLKPRGLKVALDLRMAEGKAVDLLGWGLRASGQVEFLFLLPGRHWLSLGSELLPFDLEPAGEVRVLPRFQPYLQGGADGFLVVDPAGSLLPPPAPAPEKAVPPRALPPAAIPSPTIPPPGGIPRAAPPAVEMPPATSSPVPAPLAPAPSTGPSASGGQ